MTHTAAHNAIVIDGESERETEGRLIALDLSAENPIAVVATDPQMTFYEGVDQLRCIALLGGSYVVFDRVVADKPHTIDRYQYGKPTAALGFKSAALEALPPGVPKGGVFSQMEGGPCGRELRIDFGDSLRMRLICDGDMSAYKGVTVGTYQATPMEFTFARREGAKEATFLAAFTPGKDVEPPALRIIKSEAKELAFEVKAADKTYTVTIKPDQKSVAVTAQ